MGISGFRVPLIPCQLQLLMSHGPPNQYNGYIFIFLIMLLNKCEEPSFKYQHTSLKAVVSVEE